MEGNRNETPPYSPDTRDHALMDFGIKNVQSSFLLLSELTSWNVQSFFVSPGSRSTPLVLALSQLKNVFTSVVLDERSASFGALGWAKSSKTIPALICTSGTAVANYFPAVVESSQSRIPFVLLTADRPIELIGTGAPQTIVQNNIFGEYVCACIDFEPAKFSAEEIRERISEGLQLMLKTGKPVHFNLQFRKPLQPSIPISEVLKDEKMDVFGRVKFDDSSTDSTTFLVPKCSRPLFVAGEIPFHKTALWKNSDEFKKDVPMFVEPSSNLPKLWNFWEGDIATILKNPPEKPDLIVRLGRMPVNRHLYRLLEQFKEIPTVHISFDGFFDNPIFAKVEHQHNVQKPFDLKLHSKILDSDWMSMWKNPSKITIHSDDSAFTDGQVHRTLSPILKAKHVLYSNSFPVRDAHSFGFSKHSHIHVNRGASGIDGIISTAAGIALGSKEPSALFIGDLAFQHDSNGLSYHSILKETSNSVVIIVVNNGGGGIFDMLPIGTHDDVFEKYFFTPQHISIQKLCEAHSIPYVHCQSKDDLIRGYTNADETGFTVIECQTNHTLSMKERRLLWKEL